MKLQFVLQQVNKQGNVSFKFVKIENLGNNEDDVTKVSTTIASFCKDVIKLVEKNEKNGFKSAFNGIKKSLPMQIEIIGLDEDDDIKIGLEYRNFWKFAHEATEAKIKNLLADNIEFTLKWGNE